MLPTSSHHYALKVSGVSMIEEGIMDGDIVIVHDQQTVDDGEKAVAYMPERNEVTLKRFTERRIESNLSPPIKLWSHFTKQMW